MDVSIIIPFYNSGKYLPDALESVKPFINGHTVHCELIIVNDGSTDIYSITLLEELKAEGYNILHQDNKGPAAARNNGIRNSTGEFIVFLDADNKLRPSFILKAVETLRTNPDADIFYGKPSFFGDSTDTLFTPAPFKIEKMMTENYIDICAMFKRKVWETVGGLDEERIIIGHDDWEFWIRCGAAGFKFYFYNDVVFDYRIHGESLTSAVNLERFYEAKTYVYKKHPQLVLQSYLWVAQQYHQYLRDKDRPFYTFFKFLFHKYFKSGELD